MKPVRSSSVIGKEISADFLTREKEEALWHILYSISDKEELKKALKSFAQKQGFDKRFVEEFIALDADGKILE